MGWILVICGIFAVSFILLMAAVAAFASTRHRSKVMGKADEMADLREEVSILREEVHRLREEADQLSDMPDGAIHEGEPRIVPNRRTADIGTRTQACCYLSTPEHIRSFVGTFLYIYTDKGELTLADDYLRFTGQNHTPLELALKAITDISIGNYSRIAKPMRLDYLAVTYQKHGIERTLLFTPTRSWSTPVCETNKIVSEWAEALQDRTTYPEQGHSGDGVDK